VFDNGAEFFKFAELGWTPGRDERYLSNVHISYWELDERADDGLDDTYGILLGANYIRDETWMLFGRLGWSDVDSPDDPQIYERSMTIGAIYYVAERSDLAGVAINHGELAAPGLDQQTTAELFYRVQIAQNRAITPSIQWLYDPGLSDEHDRITLFGLRLRVTL